VQAILERAEAIARDRRAREVSTADLVLAIAAAAPGPARAALLAGGVRPDEMGAHLQALAGPPDRPVPRGVLPPGSDLVAALAAPSRKGASGEAALLHAALSDPTGWAARVIRALKGDPEAVREALDQALPPASPGDAPPVEEPALLPGLRGELQKHHERLSVLEARLRDLQERTDGLVGYLRVVYVVSLLLLGLSVALAVHSGLFGG